MTDATFQTGLDRAVETGLLSMAIGRLAGGAASRVSPSGTARFFGAATERSPELDYVVRVCGIRAMALASATCRPRATPAVAGNGSPFFATSPTP